MSVILGVFAHPDDEVICAGGVLSLFGWGGESVHCRFLTNGVGVRGTPAMERLDEMREAAKIMKLSTVAVGEFPDQELHTVPEPRLCRTIEEWIDAIRPAILFTHSPNDMNQDHRVVAGCVLVALRRRTNVATTYGGEGDFMLPSFAPTEFLQIGNALGVKLEALKCYKSETREGLDPRSPAGVLHRAGYWAPRGRGGYAEAYEVMWGR